MIRKFLTGFRQRKEKGDSSVVSFLILIPIVLVLLMNSLDATIFFLNKTSINSVARDGARTVAIFGGAGDEHTQTQLEKAYGGSESVATVTKNSLQNNGSLLSVTINDVSCGPAYTAHVGDETFCAVQWQYSPLPGNMLDLFMGIFSKPQTTIGTSQSEVKTDPIDIVPR